MEEIIKQFKERQEICDLLTRYAYSLDDRDWARLATCFTPDAVAVYGEDLGMQTGYKTIEETCRTALAPLDASQHMVSNFVVDINGDTAHTRCYLQAQHTKLGTPGGDNFTIAGEYRDEIVRTPDGWRIKKRELIFLWQEGNPEVIAS